MACHGDGHQVVVDGISEVAFRETNLGEVLESSPGVGTVVLLCAARDIDGGGVIPSLKNVVVSKRRRRGGLTHNRGEACAIIESRVSDGGD